MQNAQNAITAANVTNLGLTDGTGTTVDNTNKKVNIKLDSNNTNGLAVDNDGLKLGLAATTVLNE